MRFVPGEVGDFGPQEAVARTVVDPEHGLDLWVLAPRVDDGHRDADESIAVRAHSPALGNDEGQAMRLLVGGHTGCAGRLFDARNSRSRVLVTRPSARRLGG